MTRADGCLCGDAIKVYLADACAFRRCGREGAEEHLAGTLARLPLEREARRALVARNGETFHDAQGQLNFLHAQRLGIEAEEAFVAAVGGFEVDVAVALCPEVAAHRGREAGQQRRSLFRGDVVEEEAIVEGLRRLSRFHLRADAAEGRRRGRDEQGCAVGRELGV